jgi:OOP family OmpA-OmpF porin
MGTTPVRARARHWGAIASAFAAVWAGAAVAADTPVPKHFLSVGAVYITPDDKRGADYGTGADVRYASRFGESNWLEARLFTTILDTGAQTQIDFYQTGLGVDWLKPLGNQNRSHFFVLAGAGAVANDVTPKSESGTTAFYEAGFGWRATTWESWGMRPRLELRYMHDSIGDGVNDLHFGLTLEIPPKPARIVEKVVEVEKIVEIPVEVEKIIEKQVVCVVPPEQVQGPVDADGDGVMDDKDKCPGTLPGAKVDADGCVVKKAQSINLPNVEFETGSAVLTDAGKERLAPVVDFLNNQPEVQVVVIGHTDAQGSEIYNQKLSEGRAEAVAEYLESRGIAHARLSSRGRGESQPIADNKTAEGRALNRRVELRIHAK